MENFTLLLPAVLALMALRAMAGSVGWTLRTLLRGLCGFLCLWLLNSAADFTGVTFPLNAVTVLLCGTLGLPGAALIALLQLM